MKVIKYSSLIFLFSLLACSQDQNTEGFSLVSPSSSGVDFRNLLNETENFNIFKYQYFYNGSGVSVADFNNDGLEDIFFTGNMVKNRLYLNQGDLKFKDITKASGVALNEGWCTGTNAVDINQDGWMDLYVCRAAYPFVKLRKNLLLINNQDNTFTDQAEKYGIADPAHSTHSAFFDYDKDGDLDLFLLNHSTPEYSKGNLEVMQLQSKQDPANTNKLYRNDGQKFIDVSAEAGILSNVLGFSLGLAIVDINNDHYEDIVVANDFNEHDYLYLNQKDGSFSEVSEQWYSNQSKFSMGMDFADIDQNGHQDLITLDMLPESNYLQKMHSGADNYDKVELLENNGFQQQFSRNTLQLNMGNQSFSEQAQLKGVANTDWSWSPLFFDFENDGVQDLFISNGYVRDHTDMDFLQYTADQVIKINEGNDDYTFEEYVSNMPAILETNYFYQNNGHSFINQAPTWKLNQKSVSQGAAYADFDQDGDLDIVTNNSNESAFLYENKTTGNNWIKIKLKGSGQNKNALGAKVIVTANGKNQIKELQVSRGFQSSSSYLLHFGLGAASSIESIEVQWPNQTKTIKSQVNCCSIIEIEQSSTDLVLNTPLKTKTIFTGETKVLDYQDQYQDGHDLNYQRLMPQYQSDTGPIIKTADMNGDGKEDIIICPARTDEIYIFYQRNNELFEKRTVSFSEGFVSDFELADLNKDDKIDIVLARASYLSKEGESQISFLTQGNLGFSESMIDLPKVYPNEIHLIDLDGNGILDLFCGAGYVPGRYPESSSSMLLHDLSIDNKGQVIYRQSYRKMIGHISSATYLKDENKLAITGQWNKLQLIELADNKMNLLPEDIFVSNPTGLWNEIYLVDVDQDNDLDIILGNLGLNSQLKASGQNPLQIMYADLDKNGSTDPIIGNWILDKTYPLPSREDLIMQVPKFKKQFLNFGAYANIDFIELQKLSGVTKPNMLTVDTLGHQVYYNENGIYKLGHLPPEVQSFPLYSIAHLDSNANTQVYLGGNKKRNLVKIGNLNGTSGSILHFEQGKKTKLIQGEEIGLKIKGDQRSSQMIKVGERDALITCPINGALQINYLN